MKHLLFFTGRLIVGSFYLYNAANHFLKLKDLTGYAASKEIPLPELAVAGTGLLLLGAGVLIICGVLPDLAVAALVLFFVPVTFMMHNFWAVPAEMKAMEQINFAKNMALLGSALMFLAIAKPWPWSLNIGRNGS